MCRIFYRNLDKEKESHQRLFQIKVLWFTKVKRRIKK